MRTSRKGKNLLPGGSEFFPLWAVPYSMENHYDHIRWFPLNVTIFDTHVRNCVMGATPMFFSKIDGVKESSGNPLECQIVGSDLGQN